jgi:hypothetical protein
MKLKHIYLALAIIGFVVPYYFLITFVATHGIDPKAFFTQLFGSPISTFFAVDLIISSVVFLFYLRQESTRHPIRSKWLCVVVLFTVGLSCALPLFLYAREASISD